MIQSDQNILIVIQIRPDKARNTKLLSLNISLINNQSLLYPLEINVLSVIFQIEDYYEKNEFSQVKNRVHTDKFENFRPMNSQNVSKNLKFGEKFDFRWKKTPSFTTHTQELLRTNTLNREIILSGLILSRTETVRSL